MGTSENTNENNINLEKTSEDKVLLAKEKVTIAKEKFEKAQESLDLAKNEKEKAYNEYQEASKNYDLEQVKAEEKAQEKEQINIQYNQNYNNNEQYNQYQQAQQQYGFNNQQLSEYDRTHNKNIPETPEDKKKADRLCLWSVGLYLVPQIIGMIIFGFAYGFSAVLGVDPSNNNYGDDIFSKVFTGVYGILSLFSSLSQLAAFVMMIYVRVKYPKNTFGKVLMWIAIIFFAISMIAIFVVLAACMTALRDCPG